MQLLCKSSIIDLGSLTVQAYDVSSELVDLESCVELLDEVLGRGIVSLKDVLHEEVAQPTIRVRSSRVHGWDDGEQGQGLTFAIPRDFDVFFESSHSFILQTWQIVFVSQAVHLRMHMQPRCCPRVVERPKPIETFEAMIYHVGLHIEMLQHSIDHRGFLFG